MCLWQPGFEYSVAFSIVNEEEKLVERFIAHIFSILNVLPCCIRL